MELPDYVTRAEVQRVCAELGIRDWTQLTETKVTIEETRIIRTQVGGEALAISEEEFRRGLEVELEHGMEFSDANVTNNHPILTGLIVLAHLKEMLDYYIRLEVAELEGDMLKAGVAGDGDKVAVLHRRLIAARKELARAEEVAYASK